MAYVMVLVWKSLSVVFAGDIDNSKTSIEKQTNSKSKQTWISVGPRVFANENI